MVLSISKREFLAGLGIAVKMGRGVSVDDEFVINFVPRYEEFLMHLGISFPTPQSYVDAYIHSLQFALTVRILLIFPLINGISESCKPSLNKVNLISTLRSFSGASNLTQ